MKTELVFILDRSGSMHGKELDTIGGFNSVINDHRNDDAMVTTVLFSTDYKIIHDRISIDEVKEMTVNDFMTYGSTALIDAIGRTIDHIDTVHRYIRKEDLPEKTIFVIMTDGEENASTNYSSTDVKKKISQKKEVNWEFLFMGANIDAVETSKRFGIDERNAVNYHNDEKGISKAYRSMSKFVERCVMPDIDGTTWRTEVDEDFKSR